MSEQEPREDCDRAAQALENRVFELEVALSHLREEMAERTNRKPKLLRAIVRGVRDQRLVAHERRLTKISEVRLEDWSDASAELRHVVRRGNVAVVIHLFYPEMWLSHFAPALRRLDDRAIDLYVTVPSTASVESDLLVRSTHPEACLVALPNRGRDVLPFATTVAGIADLGYTAVLKLHSKRSPHIDGGDQWMRDMLDKLVPRDARVLDQILLVLRQPDVSLVGPSEHYLGLPVSPYSMRANLSKTAKILESAGIYNVRFPAGGAWEHGFFRGTMFWARMDYIRELCNLDPAEFPTEAGQLDGTTAHAWERAAGALASHLGRPVYETDGQMVARIPHRSSAVQAGSDFDRTPFRSTVHRRKTVQAWIRLVRHNK